MNVLAIYLDWYDRDGQLVATDAIGHPAVVDLDAYPAPEGARYWGARLVIPTPAEGPQ